MDTWSRPPGGFTTTQLRERRRRQRGRAALIGVVTAWVAVVSSYGWVTTARPVERSDAVALFRATRARSSHGQARPAATLPTQEPSQGESRRPRERAHAEPDPAPHAAAHPVKTEQARVEAQSTREAGEARSPGAPLRPEEGVYSWATQGYEQVGGARRDFPEETQRIITWDQGENWKQHHYFSEERQIWTAFQPGSGGIDITQQRNKVTFGPVTNESKIDFTPPMLAAPSSLRVGRQWQGTWEGETYGDYAGRVLERTEMEIGGQRVVAWRMTYLINLRGEQEGRVEAEVWFAPSASVTVKEHYIQDVEAGGARYHAEWMQTLKSLEPRR